MGGSFDLDEAILDAVLKSKWKRTSFLRLLPSFLKTFVILSNLLIVVHLFFIVLEIHI